MLSIHPSVCQSPRKINYLRKINAFCFNVNYILEPVSSPFCFVSNKAASPTYGCHSIVNPPKKYFRKKNEFSQPRIFVNDGNNFINSLDIICLGVHFFPYMQSAREARPGY